MNKIFHARKQVMPIPEKIGLINHKINKMKKIKMGMIALAALTGIGSAFAFGHHGKRSGSFYYAKSNSSGFQWVTSRPAAPLSCKPGGSAACTITSTYDVTGSQYDNELPSGATVISGSDKYFQ